MRVTLKSPMRYSSAERGYYDYGAVDEARLAELISSWRNSSPQPNRWFAIDMPYVEFGGFKLYLGPDTLPEHAGSLIDEVMNIDDGRP